MPERCDIVIPIWNKRELTAGCIESIISNTRYPYRVIAVDNASEAATREYLEGLRDDGRLDIVIIRNEENLGNTKAANQGIEYSDAEYVCILDNDTVVCEGWLGEMVGVAASHQDIGVVNPCSNTLGKCPKSTSPEDITACGRECAADKGKYIEIGAAIGFCFLIKREVIEKIGGWDEVFSPGYFEDTDYSKRAAAAGYKSVCAQGAYVYHVEHASFRSKGMEEQFRKSRQIFHRRHGRPKRILYIVGEYNQERGQRISRAAYSSAASADWVWIFTKISIPPLDIPVHGNIRQFRFSAQFFRLKSILKLLSRQKKKFDVVAVSDRPLKTVLTMLKFIHRAEIKSGY